MIVTILMIVAVTGLLFYFDRSGLSPLTYSVWRGVSLVLFTVLTISGLWHIATLKDFGDLAWGAFILFAAWLWFRQVERAGNRRDDAIADRTWLR